MFTEGTCGMVYHAPAVEESPSLQRSPAYAATIHPCSTDTLGRYPPHFQEQVLHNVWCPHCGDMTTMRDFTGEVHGRSLVLFGKCMRCRGKVARVLEGPPEHVALQPGDRVIWWKRIPGSDYVYPVQATVLTLTAKRVKIEADDDGESVIRYVPRESLQRQG
jgi:hypothetical protein